MNSFSADEMRSLVCEKMMRRGMRQHAEIYLSELNQKKVVVKDACGDWMVLQQAPARATVAGTLNASTAAPVSVSVRGGSVNYTVQATLTKIAPEPGQARTVTLEEVGGSSSGRRSVFPYSAAQLHRGSTPCSMSPLL